MIHLVASAALHASLYPTTSPKAAYAEPMLPAEVEGLEPQGDNECRAPLFKKRTVDLRLLTSQQVSREPERLHETGPYKTSLTGYNTAPFAVERATMCSAVQPFRLARRSLLWHEGPAHLSGDKSGSKARVG